MKKVERSRVLIFHNRQRRRALNTPLLRRIARHLLEREFALAGYELGFHFVDEIEMARLNKEFLQHDSSTDVITFDHGSSAQHLHGEIFVSIPDAMKQAQEFGKTWQSEAVRYVIHGLLHLRGYDDLQSAKRRRMKREENRLVEAMESTFAVQKLAKGRTS